MFTVTDDARAYLAGIIDANNLPDDQAVRLVIKDEGVALAADTEKAGDTSIEHDGRTVLLVDESLNERLGEMTLKTQQTEQGERLAFV